MIVFAGKHRSIASIQRGQEDVKPGRGENGAKGLRIQPDVGLRAGRRTATVANREAAEHADKTTATSNAGRAGERGGEICRRGYGDDRHRHGRFFDDANHPSHSVLCDFTGITREIEIFDPRLLIADGLGHGFGVYAKADRNIGAPRHGKKFCRYPGAVGRIPRLHQDELGVEFGTAQKQRKRPGVIHIGADICVKNDRDA